MGSLQQSRLSAGPLINLAAPAKCLFETGSVAEWNESLRGHHKQAEMAAFAGSFNPP